MKTLTLSILTLLSLTGCAGSSHRIAQNDKTFVAGEFVLDHSGNNRLTLETPGRRYEASGFEIERQRNLAELRKRYQASNPKRWKRIVSGQDAEHVTYAVGTIARADDGRELSCDLQWTAREKPSGVCTDAAGTELPVRFN